MKRLRITVEGRTYDVTVEVLDGPGDVSHAPPAAIAHARPAVAHAGEPTSVVSQLAGTVVSIQAEVGQSVVDGEQLMVIEAMKMNTTVTAPRAGAVTAIAVETGSVVEEGQVLVTLA
ncbi:MAG: biotin/lipoyl-containing protein [Rhodospirillales bacterium]|jgi:biotin carboxyl carrier protein|nr:biotin/lipoyl-containing protein [Rhodospirillales bacterium]